MKKEKNLQLDKLRGDIDILDAQIVGLLAKRFSLIRKIKLEKNKLGIGVDDATREQTVFLNLDTNAKETGVPIKIIRTIFKQIIQISKKLQHDEI
jgi:chorismate mutase